MPLSDDEVAYLVGRGGQTKFRLENFSLARLNIDKDSAELMGTDDALERARRAPSCAPAPAARPRTARPPARASRRLAIKITLQQRNGGRIDIDFQDMEDRKDVSAPASSRHAAHAAHVSRRPRARDGHAAPLPPPARPPLARAPGRDARRARAGGRVPARLQGRDAAQDGGEAPRLHVLRQRPQARRWAPPTPAAHPPPPPRGRTRARPPHPAGKHGPSKRLYIVGPDRARDSALEESEEVVNYKMGTGGGRRPAIVDNRDQGGRGGPPPRYDDHGGGRCEPRPLPAVQGVRGECGTAHAAAAAQVL